MSSHGPARPPTLSPQLGLLWPGNSPGVRAWEVPSSRCSHLPSFASNQWPRVTGAFPSLRWGNSSGALGMSTSFPQHLVPVSGKRHLAQCSLSSRFPLAICFHAVVLRKLMHGLLSAWACPPAGDGGMGTCVHTWVHPLTSHSWKVTTTAQRWVLQ